MLTTLRRIASGTAVVPAGMRPAAASGMTSLKKVMPCRKCGRRLLLSRFVSLNPSGIRGYYSDTAGHIVALDRDKVTRVVRTDGERLYFA